MHFISPFRRLLRWQQWDSAAFLSSLAAAVLLFPAPSSVAQNAVISHAEQPSQLIRKAIVHRAPAGVRLQAGDVVESGAGPVQLEWPNGARLALGPASSVLVNDAHGMPSISLLRGWAKFATSAPGGGRMALEAGPLGLRADGASGIVHLAADKTELFVETGSVAAGDGSTIGREQYAVQAGARPLALAARTPRLFVERMPRQFLDPLVGVAARSRTAAPTPQRPLAAADIAAWRDAGLPLRARLARQFSVRLSDTVFRNEMEDMLEDQPEWRELLRRQRAPAGRTNTSPNHLF